MGGIREVNRVWWDIRELRVVGCYCNFNLKGKGSNFVMGFWLRVEVIEKGCLLEF